MNEPSSTPSWRPPNQIAKWLPAVAAAGLLGTVVVAGVALGGGDDSSLQQTQLADSAFVVDTGVSALTVPDSVPDVIGAVETSVPIEKSVLQRNLSKGLAGDDVKQVQQRLTDLGFVPGPADGIYGDQTVKAVWAYEKLVLQRERTIRPDRSRLRCGPRCRIRLSSNRADPTPRRTTPRSTCPSRCWRSSTTTSR